MPRISVINRAGQRFEIDAVPGISLMENIRDVPDGVAAICGGMCACSTCHVFVAPDEQDRLQPRSYEETFMLRGRSTYDENRSRLSCQIVVDDSLEGLSVTVAPDD